MIHLSWFSEMIEWGVRPETPTDEAYHYRMTNGFMLLMALGSVVETAFCFVSGATEAALLNSTAPLVFGGGLLAMKHGYTTAARVGVLAVAYIASYAMAAALGPESYFQFLLLVGSALAFVFFSTNERWKLLCGVAMPLGGFCALEYTRYRPVFGMSRAVLDPNHLSAMRVATPGLIWFLLVLHFLYFTRDRRKSQEQLIASAKMVAMGRMAAGIAHEVNNPLQLIVSHGERLKSIAASCSDSGIHSAATIAEVAEAIQAVAMRIAIINKGLLELSRNSSGDPFLEVSVHSILNLALEYSRARLEANQIHLNIDEIPRAWTVIGRETQLSEVVLNVLNNAHDAVVANSERWIEIKVAAFSDHIEIAIADSGPGVDEKIRARIFDPFFTTKPVGKGTGLGLSLSQNIMKDHRGTLQCDSSTERGARFVIRAPRGADRVSLT